MNNSVPSTSDDKSIDLLETCKSCNEKFEDKTILIHLNKKKSCKSKYSKEELEYIEGWSKERKKVLESIYYESNKDSEYLKQQRKSNNLEYWKRKKSLIAAKRKKKPDLSEICKGCDKKMGNKSILKHLSQKKSCEEKYTAEEMAYLRGLSNEKK